MASVETQQRKKSGPRYIVRWRGEGPDRPTEYFDDLASAERFRDLVSGHGERWPPGWIRGEGFVTDLRKPESMFEPWML
ncbi:hypothetical protein [Streptomyces sp. NPDC088725]|uniref:hypothetical protein n=1 Tax=Streptomyces sp. NPDC088725 TaxID=3365873 RepID=UPI003810039D